jgi:sulfate transport system ATP-binding protein
MSIVLEGLTKRFGKNLVVNAVSLDIQDGELFVLLGGSGSGKSTILRIIAGLSQPDSGTVQLNGKDVVHLPPQARGTGFVFQNYSIFRHMTAAENTEFGLRIRGVAAGERRKRRDELLDLVGLSGLGARFPDQLSGGQQQRVALARALAYNPAVLLLDEPFGALDVKIRSQLRRTLKEIQRSLKVTTILVTHDQEEAFELADRIGVIERGSLIEVGSPEELYQRPRTELVATFLGGGNVLVGRVEKGKIRLGEALLPVPPDRTAIVEDTPVRVLVRPETVLVQPEPFPEDKIVLGRGRVIERVFSGSNQRIRLEVAGLRGTWRGVSQPDYGSQATQIEALQRSDPNPADVFSAGRELWVGIKSYHVLESAYLKVLISTDGENTSDAAVDFGCTLAAAVHGPATLLAVDDSADRVAALREKLEETRRQISDRLAQLETRVRQGTPADETVLEAQEGHYEVVVVARGETADENLPRGVRELLERIGVPVLIVPTSRPSIQRVLICTAVGEPGKTDILFGGRLASLAGASATLFHVIPGRAMPERRAKAERHLRHGVFTLETLGVASDYKIGEEPAVEGILAQAEALDCDLIVIGAPAPRSHRRLLWHDLAARIVSGSTRPVLLVPMVE